MPDKAVQVSGLGSNYVHVVLGKKDDRTFIHLINAGGEHFNKNVMVYDQLLPTISLTISYKPGRMPSSVKLQPSGENINFIQTGNRIEFVVPPVEVHSIIEIKQ